MKIDFTGLCQGRRLQISGNSPLDLGKEGMVWVLETGQVDIFAVSRQPGGNEKQVVRRFHTARFDAGEVLFSIADTRIGDEELSFLAIGTLGTQVTEIPFSDFLEQPDKCGDRDFPDAAIMLWLDRLFVGIGGLKSAVPGDIERIDNEKVVPECTSEKKFAVRHGLCWMRKESVHWYLLGRKSWPEIPVGNLFPLTPGLWFTVDSEEWDFSRVRSAELVDSGELHSVLADFHTYFSRCLTVEMKCREEHEIRRLKLKSQRGREDIQRSIGRFTSIFTKKDKRLKLIENRQYPLLAACQMVGDALSMKIEIPVEKLNSGKIIKVEDVARFAGFKFRKVILDGDWWQDDCGSILGFLDEKPVALIPVSARRYYLCDPATGERKVIDRHLAQRISPLAFTFYRSFPDRPINGWDLLKFGLERCRGDMLMVVTMGVIGALLGLLTPLATGLIFDSVIPEASRGNLGQITAILLTCAFVTTLFDITRGIAIVRLEGRVDVDLQAAVWDRLISLPVPFFKKFTAGDLANRGLGISAIRQILSGVTVNTLLTFVFSSFNIAVLFYYDWQLALVALAFLGGAICFIFLLNFMQLHYHRELTDIEGHLSGQILQFITGIAKLRVSGSEDRAFAVWAAVFSRKKSFAFKSGMISNVLKSFNAMLPVIALITIFVWVVWKRQGDLSTGHFLAFIAAFSSFQNAAIQMAVAMVMSLNVIPLYERAKPILQSLPEKDENREAPGKLSGDIEVNHIFFKYIANGPLVLHDVSIRAAPGEFIAIVGGSGSGKSTLFRILLGFETAESGTIFYSGKDLSTLDVTEVRKQMGVVLQNASLFPDSIFKNIVGVSDLSLEDAWDAARKVGIADDIEAMPMQMNTVVSMGGGGLSGGQRQRLIIARAIAKKPGILLFDEATSALDNETQNIVSKSLEDLDVTRIVIAHRLSTIMNADRIYVLQNGEILQVGTYEELIRDEQGYFYQIARRQIV